MKYSTYIKPRIRTTVRPRFRWSFFLKRLFKGFWNYSRYIALGLFITFLLVIVVKSSVLTFDLSKVKIQGVGSYINYNDFIVAIDQEIKGKNLIDINTLTLETNLKNKFCGIKNISIKKKVPTYLIVDVTERVPEILIKTGNSRDSGVSSNDYRTFLIADDGFVLSELSEDTKDLFLKYKNIPNLEYDGDVKVGSFIDQRSISLYKDIRSGLDRTSLHVNNMVFSDKLVTLFLNDDVLVYLSMDKPIGNSLEIVYSVITKFNTEDKKISKIDLRYDKVIVSYK